MTNFASFQAAYSRPFEITQSDTVNLSKATTGGIYVGGAGSVVAVLWDGSTVTFTGVPAGAILPVVVIRVNATGTTATGLVGLD